MSQPTNLLQGFLAVYPQKALNQFIADMPLVGKFCTDFSDTISDGGVSVTTQLPISTFGSPNDTAANGYLALNPSSSLFTLTLKQRDYTQDFTELQWATVTPAKIQNTFLPPMIKQLANGIVSDALSQIVTSSFTNVLTIPSASAFSSSTVFSASNALTTYEVPFEDRYIIDTPNAYQGLISSINPAYVYGNTVAIQDYHGIKLGGFNPILEYPRLTGNTVTNVGGAAYTGGAKLVGVAGQKQGLLIAYRPPVDVNNGLVYTATAKDPSSGLNLQVRVMYDIPRGVWKLAVTTIYAVTAGNPNAIVPIVSNTTV